MEARTWELPDDFKAVLIERYGSAFASALLEGFNQPAGISIRLHPHKGVVPEGARGPFLHCPYGYSLPERPVFTLDPAFHAGAYYVQESSSMLLHWVMGQLNRPHRVLDLCAAPGGKSLLALDYLLEGGWLWSNEVHPKRFSALQENLQRWGMPQVVCSQRTPAFLAKHLPDTFDWVVLDAPCSGEGMFRKDSFACSQWSRELGNQCARTQKEILEAARTLVSPGGYLIYSTCTLNPDENEFQVRDSLQGEGWECIELIDAESFGAHADRLGLGYYAFPGIGPGEGFYFSIWQKPGGGVAREVRKPSVKAHLLPNDWIWESSSEVNSEDVRGSVFLRHPEASELAQALGQHADFIGVQVSESGQMAHSAALLSGLKGGATVALDESDALMYLQGLALPGNEAIPRGQVMVQWKGLGLGWAKNIGSRFNNQLPKFRRIRMAVPKKP